MNTKVVCAFNCGFELVEEVPETRKGADKVGRNLYKTLEEHRRLAHPYVSGGVKCPHCGKVIKGNTKREAYEWLRFHVESFHG